MENEILGPAIRKGLKQGLEQGLEQGREEGRGEGERKLARRFIEKRFGAIPEWAEERLSALATPEIEALSDRIFVAQSLEELFG